MTNGERRQALAKARVKALEYADQAVVINYSDAYEISRSVQLAQMWAGVAQALKVGDPIADAVIDHESILT